MGAMLMSRQIALIALCFSTWTGSAGAAALAPHRAVYDLSLAKGRNETGVVGAEGRLIVDLDDVCDSWASTERMVLRLSSAQNVRTLLDYRFSSIEGKDGAAYRYTSATFADGTQVEARKGHVATGEDGVRIVTVETPEAPDFPLPMEARFPVGLLGGLTQAAAGGARSYEGLLFDGVSETPLTLGAAAIAPLGEEPSPPAELAGLARWRVSAAYFNPDAPAGEPDYEVAFDLYENGVAARMTMDYAEFTLQARLTEVVIRPPCAP